MFCLFNDDGDTTKIDDIISEQPLIVAVNGRCNAILTMSNCWIKIYVYAKYKSTLLKYKTQLLILVKANGSHAASWESCLLDIL